MPKLRTKSSPTTKTEISAAKSNASLETKRCKDIRETCEKQTIGLTVPSVRAAVLKQCIYNATRDGPSCSPLSGGRRKRRKSRRKRRTKRRRRKSRRRTKRRSSRKSRRRRRRRR